MAGSTTAGSRWTRVRPLRAVTDRNSATMWISLGTVAVAGVLEFVFFAQVEVRSDWLDVLALPTMALLMASGALMLRYLFAGRNLDNERFPRNRALLWVFATPLLVLIVLLPLFVSAAKNTGGSVAEAIGLYGLVSIGALLAGLLLVSLVLVPLEFVGRGLLRLLRGAGKESSDRGKAHDRRAVP